MKPPTHALVAMLFGAQAELILADPPERLRRWDAAFDEWLRSTHERSPKVMAQRYAAWRSLLRFTLSPPWELKPASVQAWIDHLVDERGYTPHSIAHLLSMLRNFYRFVAEQAIESLPLVDPLEQLKGPYVTQTTPLYSLSEAELAAFLAAIEPDASPLAMRNYAMVLLIVFCGLSPREARLIRWGELSADWENSRLSLQRANLTQPFTIDLPPDVTTAIHAYLQAAGRLENIQADEFLFPGAREWCGKMDSPSVKGWYTSLPLAGAAFEHIVHTIAARAGLQAERVTPRLLRNTGLARRIQLGDDIAALQRFCGFYERNGLYRLRKRITSQPQDVLWKTQPPPEDAPAQRARLYAGAIPAEDLQRLEQAQPGGLQDEIDALRLTLLRTLRQAQTTNPAEQMRLLDSYSLAAARLASLLKAQKELNQASDDFDLRLDEALRQAQEQHGWDLGLGSHGE